MREADYLIEGYSYSFEPEKINSDYTTGNRRQRVRFENPDMIFNVSENLTQADFDLFEVYVNDTLNNGADSFSGNYWDGAGETSATISIVNGEYSFQYIALNSIKVDYQIEVKDRSLDYGATLYLFNELGIDDAWVNALEDMVNNNAL
jgi:hypothetical protein